MARKGLGKGLDAEVIGGAGLAALLGEDPGAAENIKKLKITSVEPRIGQPRTVFDPEALEELAESIREHGILQPITVRDAGGYYEIIAGERRWRAARLADLKEIPAIVIEADDKKASELAMVENLQREDLSAIEEARGYRSLMDSYGYTQENVAARVGKSRPVVANALRLLNLPESVQRLVEEKKLPLSHARLLLELKTPELMESAAETVVENGLSVKKTEQLVRMLNADRAPKPPKSRSHADGVDYYAEVEKALTSSLGRKVRISAGAKRGKFEIEYYGSEDFEILYEALLKLKKGRGD